jgi:uncharacterized protein DUF5320
MPGQDGTGPNAEGSMTGRGLGPCGRGSAFRNGSGRGFGRGFRRRMPFFSERAVPVYREPTKEQELNELETEQKELNSELDSVRRRLEELKSKE